MLTVSTTHSIVTNDDKDPNIEVFVDSDDTAQIRLGSETDMRPWMNREDLLALRRAITRAIKLMA